jgi:hypothetical protein
MKTKIVGILVCMLLITTLAIPISALNQDYELPVKPTGKTDDVPVWKVGDTWTYDMTLYIAASPNVTDDMVAEVSGELTYEVVDDTSDSYKLTGLMRPMIGTVDLPGNVDMRLTRLSSYSSNLEVNKADISIINHEFLMKGIVLLTLGPIPLPIPIQIQSWKLTEIDPAFNLMPFPLYDGKTGTLANSTITEQMETSLFWGLITVEKKDDIEFYTGDVDYTVASESITVEAGTFDVFNVSAELPFGEQGLDIYRSYYAEDIGNVAKSLIHIDYAETGETYYLMGLELKSTTYEP